MRIGTLAACAALFVSAPLRADVQPTPAPRAASSSEQDEARLRSLVREAEKSFEAGRVQHARGLLLDAWRIRPSYDIASSLGQTELELENYAAAARYLAYSVRHIPPTESEELLNTLRGGLDGAKKHVATLTVRVQPANANVRVDGAPAFEAPFGPEVFVAPGRHVVEAEHEGRVQTQSVDVVAGEERAIDFVVPTPVVAPAPTRARPATGPHAELMIAGGALALVGVGLGIGLASDANAAEERRDQRLRDLGGPQACQSPVDSETAEECSEVRDVVRKVDRSRNWSTASFAVAAVAAAGTAIYFWWPRSDAASASTSASSKLLPTIGTRELGLTLFSTF